MVGTRSATLPPPCNNIVKFSPTFTTLPMKVNSKSKTLKKRVTTKSVNKPELETVKEQNENTKTPTSSSVNEEAVKNPKRNSQAKTDKYFDDTSEPDKHDLTDADNTQDSELLEVLSDDSIRELRDEVITLCNAPEIAKKRNPETVKAIRAIEYAKFVMIRSTRTPASVRREVEGMLEAVRLALLELEARLQHAEAKNEVLEHIKDYLPANTTAKHTQANRACTLTQNEERHRVNKPPVTFAEAVKKATSTLIIKSSEDRVPEEVEKQVLGKTKAHQNNIKRVNRIRNGVSIHCDSAKDAQALKRTLLEDEETKVSLQVKEAGLKKKKVMIFSIPEDVTPEQIGKKLVNTLGITGPEYTDNIIQIGTYRNGRGGLNHCPVLLPEPLANALLKRRTVCLGLKNCPVRNFVQITRCHRCMGLDHIAANCELPQRCSICSGEHSYRECMGRRENCALCEQYNTNNRQFQNTPRDTAHAANSGSCWVYNTLLKIRQIEMDQGKKTLTKGVEVLKGTKTIVSYSGRTKILTRNEENSTIQQQRKNRRR